LIVVGFSTYYLVPYTLAKGKNTMLFLLMNLILVLVILGLAFICMLLFEYCERLLLWICMQTCCRRDRRLHHVIKKNMEAHRQRNAKTSIMFTLAISYLIFSASSFLLLSAMITDTTQSLIGADIRVGNTDGFLNEIRIAEFLEGQKTATGNPVIDYAFRTASLTDFFYLATGNGDTDRIYSLGGYKDTKVHLYGVPQNFMNVIDTNYYIGKDV